MLLTVFTPVYNRADLLPRLYHSLLAQTDQRFEWLIVDDGSADDPETLVYSWQAENRLTIRFIRQENGGKHRAWNTGVEYASGTLFYCVDSDDLVPPDCVKQILSCSEQVSVPHCMGLVANKQDFSENPLGKPFPKDLKYTSLFHLSAVIGSTGERALIYKTALLRQNLFPTVPGERFMTECVLYDALDCTGGTLFILDQTLALCAYQADGLSKNAYRLMLENPTGYKAYYCRRIDMAPTVRLRIGYLIRYHAFSYLSGSTLFPYAGRHRFLFYLTAPLGFGASLYYKFKKELHA